MNKNEYVLPILYEYLYNIDIRDSFFDSLKYDYYGFEKWYRRKSLQNEKAYITYDSTHKLGSFLLLKLEDERESYTNFDKSFSYARRLKICTFKVTNTGNGIGDAYFDIISQEAEKK